LRCALKYAAADIAANAAISSAMNRCRLMSNS
jgi:hypothetical protein